MKRPRKQYTLQATIRDKRGRVLTRGTNSYVKTHPLQVSLSQQHGNGEAIYLHAEIQAIVRLKPHHKPYSIHIERYSKGGEPLLAKPCPLCERAIQLANIRQVSHTEPQSG